MNSRQFTKKQLRRLFETYAAYMQQKNNTEADTILNIAYALLDRTGLSREDVYEHVCPHCDYTPITSAIKDGLCPNCLKSGIVSPDEEEDIITTVVIKLTRKQIMTNAVAHHIFHSAIELQVLAKELGDKSLTKEEYDQLKVRINVMFIQKLKALNIDPPELGGIEPCGKINKVNPNHKLPKGRITDVVMPLVFNNLTNAVKLTRYNTAMDEIIEKGNENKRLRAALEWWFGATLLSRSEGRVTHQLMRTRHEGWICVKSIPGETFFGYLKHGAKTYMNAIDAILGAFDKYKESKSQGTA